MKVQIEKVGDRIHVRSPYAYKDRIKGIIGARWSPKKKVWTLPLDMETCRRARDEFGDELEIMSDLWEWASAEAARESNATALLDSVNNSAEPVDLPRVRATAPTMWAAMQDRPYQTVAAKYMSEMTRCLNADEPGIGKTIETLAALVESGTVGPVLVLAPKTSCLVVWEAEIRRWLADDVPYTVTNLTGLPPKKREEAWLGFTGHVEYADPNTIHFLISNAEQVRIKVMGACPDEICNGDEDWCPSYAKHAKQTQHANPFLHSVVWSAVVADETHKWLINTRGKSASQVGYGFTRLRVKEGGAMYALSGTPLKGKRHNLFGTLNWLWPKTYTSKWRWVESYFEVVVDIVWGGKVQGNVTTRTITGEWKSERAKAAFFRSMKTLMVRRTKRELRAINPAWMPPDKVYHDVWVPMSGSQRTHYNAMAKNARVEIEGQVLSATGVLAELTRLKQFAGSDGAIVQGNYKPTLPSAKFDWLLEFLAERGIEPGELSDDVRKVVIASQFTTLINLWHEALAEKGIDSYLITGEVKDSVRASVVEMFQDPRGARVCLINTTAGGVSITLDAADDVVIMDETWVPDDQLQVEDRVHRASNVTHNVDVWYVRTLGTVEEDIAQATESKAESNHIVLDAQRGLEFARRNYKLKEK